jgi:chitinase
MNENKAIVVIAHKLLIGIWHVLTKRTADRYTPGQVIARYLMGWVTEYRLSTHLGIGRIDFVKRELERLGIREQISSIEYGSRIYQLSEKIH